MAGIYVHIPFCKQRCTYCDFHFSTSFHSYRQQMIDAMVFELVNRSSEIEEVIETIYFGGGTPSLLLESELTQLMETIFSNYSLSESLEVTLESNPDDIDEKSLSLWKKLGINRLSIGLQSFRTEDLIWMNRAHNVDESLNSVKLAQAIGFENITVDLMYGLPNLSLEDWKKNIQTVIDFKIPHISAYCLTVEERTALDKKVKDGALKPLDEEEQAEQFQQLVSLLKENGYEQYEISNFALPNQYAKHNSAYWKGTSYLGIGPSSHSFDGKVRRFNVANNALYIKGFHDNSIPFEHELLTPENRFNEILMTGLRTKWGVDLAELEKILPLSESFHLDLKSAFDQKWLYRVDQRIFLTEQGKLMADQVASSLFY